MNFNHSKASIMKTLGLFLGGLVFTVSFISNLSINHKNTLIIIYNMKARTPYHQKHCNESE